MKNLVLYDYKGIDYIKLNDIVFERDHDQNIYGTCDIEMKFGRLHSFNQLAFTNRFISFLQDALQKVQKSELNKKEVFEEFFGDFTLGVETKIADKIIYKGDIGEVHPCQRCYFSLTLPCHGHSLSLDAELSVEYDMEVNSAEFVQLLNDVNSISSCLMDIK